MTEQPTPYEILGGEEGVRKLVDRFYDHMDELEEAKDIRGLHARSLRGSRDKLFLFLSGWLGGPDLYVQKFGHPRLRARHLPFSIGIKEREQWMHCMRKALDDMGLEKTFRDRLEQAFLSTADHMRNRAEYDGSPGLVIGPGK
jgi:hemoglobin